jgi:uncharacterized protein YaaW (UPF0174 family)
MKNYREDIDLINVLQSASFEDISILIDIITDSGKGRISLEDSSKDVLLKAKASGAVDEACMLCIAAEIQQFGGNSLISIFRGGKGVLYKEIVCDVADHVGANYNDKTDIGQIECAILVKIVERSLEKMSEDEKKQFFDQFGVRYMVSGAAAHGAAGAAGAAAMAGLIIAIRSSGFAFYKMATIVAQATAKALLGKSLTFAATGGLMRGVSVLAGPVGWAITGIWTAFDLASPAYRITVPCVIQLAYMRQQSLINECPSCHSPVITDAKFCGECGHNLKGEPLIPFKFGAPT